MSAFPCSFCGSLEGKSVIGPNAVCICENCIRRSYLFIIDWPRVEPSCGICKRQGIEFEEEIAMVCVECATAAREARKKSSV